MTDRLIIENSESKLARAIQMNMSDMMNRRGKKGEEGISVQKITGKMTETGEPILIHESKILRRHDGEFSPIMRLKYVPGEVASMAVINRRSQEGLFPIHDKLNMFGPLTDVPDRNTILCMDAVAASVIDAADSVDSLDSDFQAIEGKIADHDDIERAREVESLYSVIRESRVLLMRKQNEIASFHPHLRGMNQKEFEKSMLGGDGEAEHKVEEYMVLDYLDILQDITDTQDQIQALSGAVFNDVQELRGFEVDSIPQFDFRVREGWNFG